MSNVHPLSGAAAEERADRGLIAKVFEMRNMVSPGTFWVARVYRDRTNGVGDSLAEFTASTRDEAILKAKTAVEAGEVRVELADPEWIRFDV